MANCSYTFRRHLFDTETTYVLTNDAILIQPRGGAESTLLLNDVHSLQLRDEGAYRGVHVYSCVLQTKQRKLVLRSADYVKFGEVEPRPTEYAEFVRALLEKLQSCAQYIRFDKGSHGVRLTAVSVLVFSTLCIAGLAVASCFSSGMSIPRLLTYSIALIAAAPGMLAVIRLGRPRSFNPAHVPAEYLP